MELIEDICFAEESVVSEDIEKLELWHRQLKEADVPNVQFFIMTVYHWSTETVSEYEASNKHVLSAVGSSIEGKPNYQDIDFLLLSNMCMRDLYNNFYPTLEEKLRERFYTSINPYPLSKYRLTPYECHSHRAIALLRPREKGAHIHLILQPEFSEEGWDNVDKYNKVKIFRTQVTNDNPRE